MSKLFNVVGFSTLAGVRKMRVANGLSARIAKLMRTGHTDIEMYEMPSAVDKQAALVWLAARVAPISVFRLPQLLQLGYSTAKEAMTLEQALATIPLREKGRFIAHAVRMERAEALMG
jgi:hypothetical protein